ncbi:hypothetical protein N7G274_001883 [Stereocaulon virgatum]|uniref:Uncharacterized protein n=1 Tax=Stereocaulon virgatum TaxID=373712 RepID=A0ABR4ALQ9_9LECA
MYLLPSFAAVALFLSTSTIVSSLSTFTKLGTRNVNANGNGHTKLVNLGCAGPSQINLNTLDADDPGLGGCNWKKWVECTALAVGGCLPACEAGGFLDPACDLCIEGLGVLGCKQCVSSQAAQELWSYQQTVLAMSSSKIIAQHQSDYCIVPKPAANLMANTTAVNNAPPSAISSRGFSLLLAGSPSSTPQAG